MDPESFTEPRDLTTHAYVQLRSLIVLGRLAPGGRIIESDLADRLGVSRTPVRSALQRLQQEGFITALEGGKNARLTVAPLTSPDAREILCLLGSLEGLAMRWVAQMPEAQRQSLAMDLRAANRELDEALRAQAPEPERVFELHTRFHVRHLELVSSPRLLAMHEAISPQAERYRRVYITTAPSGFQGEVEEHEAIVEALLAGDPDAAHLAVQRNWERTSERMAHIVDRLGSRGDW